MIPFPNKKYNIIYADPPWYFKSYSSKGEGRNATQHYSCMSISDICNLPVNNLAEKNCILFMWVIDPMLPEAFEVIKSWGFTYKTVAFTWVKQNKKSDGNFTGLGYWTRSNPEMCLLATKGKPQRVSKSVKQLIIDKRREHSRKPDRIRNDIVELCGDLPRIELFARQKFDGWYCWGNEV
jgi:N6-adenosine-specific RNA methylase IME4